MNGTGVSPLLNFIGGSEYSLSIAQHRFTVPCAVKAQKQPVSAVQQVEKLAYRSGVFLKSTRCGEPAGKLCHGAHNGVILVYLFRDKLI